MSSSTDWRSAPRPSRSVPWRGKMCSTNESAICRARLPAASFVNKAVLPPAENGEELFVATVVVRRQRQQRTDGPLEAEERHVRLAEHAVGLAAAADHGRVDAVGPVEG